MELLRTVVSIPVMIVNYVLDRVSDRLNARFLAVRDQFNDTIKKMEERSDRTLG